MYCSPSATMFITSTAQPASNFFAVSGAISLPSCVAAASTTAGVYFSTSFASIAARTSARFSSVFTITALSAPASIAVFAASSGSFSSTAAITSSPFACASSFAFARISSAGPAGAPSAVSTYTKIFFPSVRLIFTTSYNTLASVISAIA